MIEIKYFLENNSGGQKTREVWLKKNNLEYFLTIKNWSNKYGFNDLPYKEQIFLCCNRMIEVPKCKICKNNLKFKKSISEGYPENYCSMKCMNSSDEHKIKVNGSRNSVEIVKKIKSTTFKNYGVDNIFKRTDIIKESYIKKYGVDHPLKCDDIKIKQKNTLIEKYGNWPINSEKSRLNLKKTLEITTNKKYPGVNFTELTPNYVKIICNICNKEYKIDRALLHYRFNTKINPCTICNPIMGERSIKEKELSNWISKHTKVIRGDKTILNGKEIDIFLPDYNIGIEFNGLYYHSNLFIDNKYHLNKTIMSNEVGVNLIHIFEDEWIDKSDIIKSIILNLLNKTPNKIYGRKCIIREISNNESKVFLIKNHIQGNAISSINVGLFYDDELVSLMTFGNRKITGKKQMELIRFCNKINTNVIGGASKIFNYFINKYDPGKIISYQDNRLFNGDLYEKLGFKYIKLSEPNYYYVINKKRDYRYNWRKDVLVRMGYNPNLTEKEIMDGLGYYRIYDCGSKVWEYSSEKLKILLN